MFALRPKHGHFRDVPGGGGRGVRNKRGTPIAKGFINQMENDVIGNAVGRVDENPENWGIR